MGRTGPRSISVAIAVIERRGRFLVCQRSAHDDFAGYWEFPGGKRERGESWRACLRREVREELGISVRAIVEFDRYRYRYPEHHVAFRIFRCALARGRPRPLDAQALRWVPLNRLRRYRFPPANRRLVERLMSRLPAALRHGIIKKSSGRAKETRGRHRW